MTPSRWRSSSWTPQKQPPARMAVSVLSLIAVSFSCVFVPPIVTHDRGSSDMSVSAPEPEGVRSGESLGSLLAAFAANAAIALAKGVAAVFTGSPALLAETLHTVADAGNEVLLFVAIRRSRQPADASHPFGYGPERYYWALPAAIGMFVIGGAVSIWNGIRALIHPPELEAFWVGVAVLVSPAQVDRLRAPRRARLDPDRPAALLPRLRADPSQPRRADQPSRARALRRSAPGAARDRGR